MSNNEFDMSQHFENLARRGLPPAFDYLANPTDAAQPGAEVPDLALSPKEVRSYSLRRALDCARMGHWRDRGFEGALSVTLTKMSGLDEPSPHELWVPPQVMGERLLNTAAPSEGGYLAGTHEAVGVLPALRPALVVGRAGARTVGGFVANATFARTGSSATITWHPEEDTQSVPTEDFDLGAVHLTPKTVTAYVRVGHLVRRMSEGRSEELVRRELRAALVQAVDRAALNGTGTNGQPMGLLQVPGINTFTGASLTYAELLNAQQSILEDNALAEVARSVSFLTRAAIANTLSRRQAFSADTSLWQGPLAAGRLVDCPAYTSQNVPAATVIGGDFQQMLLAEFGPGLRIQVDPVANFQSGGIAYAAYLSMDVAVLRPQSFAVATGVS